MFVLAILTAVTVFARLLGIAGVASIDSWPVTTRCGLAAMFLFTGVAHFNSLRFDLARMVPPIVRQPLAVIYFTGACEMIGAVGLLLPSVRVVTAGALILLLLAVLPANVYAAKAGIRLRGKPPTPLAARVPMQFVFIACIWWAGMFHGRS